MVAVVGTSISRYPVLKKPSQTIEHTYFSRRSQAHKDSGRLLCCIGGLYAHPRSMKTLIFFLASLTLHSAVRGDTADEKLVDPAKCNELGFTAVSCSTCDRIKDIVADEGTLAATSRVR